MSGLGRPPSRPPEGAAGGGGGGGGGGVGPGGPGAAPGARSGGPGAAPGARGAGAGGAARCSRRSRGGRGRGGRGRGRRGGRSRCGLRLRRHGSQRGRLRGGAGLVEHLKSGRAKLDGIAGPQRLGLRDPLAVDERSVRGSQILDRQLIARAPGDPGVIARQLRILAEPALAGRCAPDKKLVLERDLRAACLASGYPEPFTSQVAAPVSRSSVDRQPPVVVVVVAAVSLCSSWSLVSVSVVRGGRCGRWWSTGAGGRCRARGVRARGVGVAGARGRGRAALGLRLGLQLRERAHGGDRWHVRRAVGHLDLLGALGLGRSSPPLESSPPLALPTANEAPNRTTAAAASARRVRPALTHSPSFAASSSPASCRRSAQRAGFRTGTTLRRMNRPVANLAVTRTVIVVPYGSDFPMTLRTLQVPGGLRPHRSAGGGGRALDGQLAAAAPARQLALDHDARALGHPLTKNLSNRMPFGGADQRFVTEADCGGCPGSRPAACGRCGSRDRDSGPGTCPGRPRGRCPRRRRGSRW